MRKLDRTFFPPPLAPPRIEKGCVEGIVHGVRLSDDYAWLRAENWREVLRGSGAISGSIRAVIEAENNYADAMLAPAAELREELVKEMRGRIVEDDCEVPRPDGAWLYYIRHRMGGQHPVFCRSRRSGSSEQVLLDGDVEGRGKSFFELGTVRHAPDHAELGWSSDVAGAELYAIRIRAIGLSIPLDKKALRDCSEVIENTSGEFVWMADSKGLYYVRMDENHRPAAVFRHRVGSDPHADICVYETNDPGLFVHLRRSQSGRFAMITVGDHDSTECLLLDLADSPATPRLIEPRAPGLRYEAEHHGSRLFLRTNAGEAEDFKIVSAPLENPGRAFWTEEVPHRPGRMIIRHAVFPDHLVRIERESALPRIVVRHLPTGEEHAIEFACKAYSLGLEERYEFETDICRFTYSSMAAPWETYDYNLSTRERVLCKRQIIPSGHYPSRYVTQRHFAKAADGEEIPITLLYRAGLTLDGSAPLLLYGYGAYGSHVPASFSSERLSLVDRGFVYAIAHVRGGTDKGWHWYLDGKFERKPNTFTDFLTVANHLIAAGYTSAGRIVAQGCSAGGMLVGAAANMAPELFAGIIADVPFVDVLNTMLDETLPLTPPEWLEWGNPISNPAIFAVMRSYSPYDNVCPTVYPPILALGGLTDARVTYWEPLKWAAKLRDTMTGGGPILLKINMGAGHGGVPGRFGHLEEVAEQYAFALCCVCGGTGNSPP